MNEPVWRGFTADEMNAMRDAARERRERHEAEAESLRQQLEGAVELVRALGSAWRADDDEATRIALVALEDWAGLTEQGGS